MTESAKAQQEQVGDTFSSAPRATGFAEWNRFAAVNDEFVPIHMDDEQGRLAGYPGAISMGRLQWSYVHNLLRDLAGADGRIVSVALRFRGPVLKDAPFTTAAQVTDVRHDACERVLDLDVWIEDGSGAVLASGTATVAVPGQPPNGLPRP
jgi:acyl dehydratase